MKFVLKFRLLLHLSVGGMGCFCMLLFYASIAAADGILVKMMRDLGLVSTTPKVYETFRYAEHAFHSYCMPLFWFGVVLVAISICLVAGDCRNR